MIEGFEPDLSVAEIDAVFDDYAAFLPDFLDDAALRRGAATAAAEGLDVEQQKAVSQDIGRAGLRFCPRAPIPRRDLSVVAP